MLASRIRDAAELQGHAQSGAHGFFDEGESCRGRAGVFDNVAGNAAVEGEHSLGK
jgi:hypothetical protein